MAADIHEMRTFQLPHSNESDTMLKYYSTPSLINIVLNLKLIFRFNVGHLGFSSSAYVGQHSPYAIEFGHPEKHGMCMLWNFDSIMSTS